MVLFISSVVLVLLVWAACSLAEAAMYAVRMPFVRGLRESGAKAGIILADFKQNMERPIAAILIINTAVSAGGAALVGARARGLFGEPSLLWFSAAFTLAALFLSEIAPKVIGVTYNRPISRFIARPLAATVTLMYPLIWLVERTANLLKPPQRVLTAPEEEVHQLAMISAEEGSIMPYEADLVRNVLNLDQITTREIMTPRPVVVKLPANMPLREVPDHISEWTYSRIPVYDAQDPETWVGLVLSRDILAGLAKDQFDERLADMQKPLFFVSEKTRGHVLLKAFLRRRSHLFGVIDEFGDVTGIVTLEDVLESLIGEEIVDELDSAVDMQEVARLRKREQFGPSNMPPGDVGDQSADRSDSSE